jgi:hypothetical protein
MKITYMSENNDSIAVTLEDGEVLGHFSGPITMSVPVCEGNNEYDNIISKNIVVSPYIAPPLLIPSSVSLWQAKAALENSKLLDAVNSIVTASNNDVLTLYWATGATISRNSTSLAQIASALNLSSIQIDQLFIDADKITL